MMADEKYGIGGFPQFYSDSEGGEWWTITDYGKGDIIMTTKLELIDNKYQLHESTMQFVPQQETPSLHRICQRIFNLFTNP